MNFKIAIILFFVFILINSDIFINRFLANVKGAVSPLKSLTTKGTIITGLILTLTYIFLDLLAEGDIL